MTSAIYRDEYTGVRIEMGLDTHDSHDFGLLEEVAQASAVENMRTVTAEEIRLGSHATYYALLGEGESAAFAGFLRQRKEQHAVRAGGHEFVLNELGTLWVRKQHRQHGVAHKLVAAASDQASTTTGAISLPFGVCNSKGIRIFEDAGHETIGEHGDRTYMLRPPQDAELRLEWDAGLGEEVVAQLPRFERFAGMTALAQAA